MQMGRGKARGRKANPKPEIRIPESNPNDRMTNEKNGNSANHLPGDR
jgi:hypothetical protein